LNSLHLFDKFEDYLNADPFDEDTFIYSRLANPTVLTAEKKIAQLENGVRAAIFPAE